MNTKHEYIKKQTPEENGDIESFHNSLKTDYIWQNDLEGYEDAKELMKYAFNDYNNCRPHSSIGYLTPVEFEKQWNSSEEFRNKFWGNSSITVSRADMFISVFLMFCYIPEQKRYLSLLFND